MFRPIKEKDQKPMVPPPLTIQNIMLQIESEFHDIHKPENENSLFDRLINNIGLLGEKAKSQHLKENFNEHGILPNHENAITRLMTHEFSFYPAKNQGPFAVEFFNRLLQKLQTQFNDYPTNLHLLLSSFPVKDDQNNVYNIAVYIQCGKPCRFNLIPKVHPSESDHSYLNTTNKGLDTLPLIMYKKMVNHIKSVDCDRIVPCITAGNTSFNTIVDICLDFTESVGKKNLRRKFSLAMESPDASFSPIISHVVTSSTINSDPSVAITSVIEQVDSEQEAIGLHKVLDRHSILDQHHAPTRTETLDKWSEFNKNKPQLRFYEPIDISEMSKQAGLPHNIIKNLQQQILMLQKNNKNDMEYITKFSQFLLDYCTTIISNSTESKLPTMGQLLTAIKNCLLLIQNKETKVTEQELEHKFAVIYSYLSVNAQLSIELRPIFKFLQTQLLTFSLAQKTYHNWFKQNKAGTLVDYAIATSDTSVLEKMYHETKPFLYENFFYASLDEKNSAELIKKLSLFLPIDKINQLQEDLNSGINKEEWNLVNIVLLKKPELKLTNEQLVKAKKYKDAILTDLIYKISRVKGKKQQELLKQIFASPTLNKILDLPPSPQKKRILFYRMIFDYQLGLVDKLDKLLLKKLKPITKFFEQLMEKDFNQKEMYAVLHTLKYLFKNSNSVFSVIYQGCLDRELIHGGHFVKEDANIILNAIGINDLSFLNEVAKYNNEGLAYAYYRSAGSSADNLAENIDYYKKSVELLQKIPPEEQTANDKKILQICHKYITWYYYDLAKQSAYLPNTVEYYARAVAASRRANFVIEKQQKYASLLLEAYIKYAQALSEPMQEAKMLAIIQKSKNLLPYVLPDEKIESHVNIISLESYVYRMQAKTCHEKKNYNEALSLLNKAFTLIKSIPSPYANEFISITYEIYTEMAKSLFALGLQMTHTKQFAAATNFYLEALQSLEKIPVDQRTQKENIWIKTITTQLTNTYEKHADSLEANIDAAKKYEIYLLAIVIRESNTSYFSTPDDKNRLFEDYRHTADLLMQMGQTKQPSKPNAALDYYTKAKHFLEKIPSSAKEAKDSLHLKQCAETIDKLKHEIKNKSPNINPFSKKR